MTIYAGSFAQHAQRIALFCFRGLVIRQLLVVRAKLIIIIIIIIIRQLLVVRAKLIIIIIIIIIIRQLLVVRAKLIKLQFRSSGISFSGLWLSFFSFPFLLPFSSSFFFFPFLLPFLLPYLRPTPTGFALFHGKDSRISRREFLSP